MKKHQSSNSSPDATSLSLLQQVKHRDDHAWQRLVDLYGPLLNLWLSRSGVQDTDRHDIFQAVFVAVAQNIERFRKEKPTDTFRGWLRTITRSKLNDHFRAQKKIPRAAGGSDAQQQFQHIAETDWDCPDPVQETNEADAVRRRAIDLIRSEFEEKTWQAFWRVAVEDQAVEAVARDLGVSPSAVRLYRSRVLKRLRTLLADLEPEI
jgi:RNA polymerase sigma-70 factor (ECF subfamily)